MKTQEGQGYLSKTLKSVIIGQKTQFQWFGEEILNQSDPKYSVIANSKVQVYSLKKQNLNILPSNLKS